MPKIVQYNLPPGGTVVQLADNNSTALDIESVDEGRDFILVDTSDGVDRLVLGGGTGTGAVVPTIVGRNQSRGAYPFIIDNGSQWIEMITGGTNKIKSQAATKFQIGTHGSNELALITGNTDRLNISGTGAITITGAVEHSGALEVKGDLSVALTGTFTATNSSAEITAGSSTAFLTEIFEGSAIEIFEGDGTSRGVYRVADVASNTALTLDSNVTGLSSSPLTGMTGKTDPTLLDVKSGDDMTLLAVTNRYVRINGRGGPSAYEPANDSEVALYIDGDDNSTDNANSTTVVIHSAATNGPSLQFANSGNINANFFTQSSKLYFDTETSAIDMVWRPGKTTFLTMDAGAATTAFENCKVGVNDATPVEKFTVKASSAHDDVMCIYSATDAVVVRLECYDNQSGAVRVVGGGNNQHLLNGRDGSNGSAEFNIRQYDCNFTASSSNSVKMLHIDASLDEVVIVDDSTGIGQEHLDETDFSSHAEWDVAGDFDDTGGDAVYTHSSGAGTLTQVQADLALAIQGDRYYVFTYTVSGVSGSDMAATITTGVAHEAVSLTVKTNGTYKTSFRAKATPGDFVISATSTTGGTTFTLDDVSLKSCGGDLIVGERINCTDSGLNLRIGDVNTGAALAASTGTYNTCIGPSAGKAYDTGTMNTAIGYQAGKGGSSSIEGTFVGYNAGAATTASKNTAIGAGALAATSGASNTAVGKEAAMQTTGVENTIVGCAAAQGNCGSYNAALGFEALKSQTSGGDGYNTAIGWKAGDSLTSTGKGVYIGGASAASAASGVSNEIAIGYAAVGQGSLTATIGASTCVSLASGGDGICELGTSSNGFKALTLKNAFTNGNTGNGTSFSITDSNGTPRKHLKLYNAGGLQLGHDQTDFYITGTTLRIGANAGGMGNRLLSTSLDTVEIGFFPEAGTQQAFTMELVQAAASSYTITWPSSATTYTDYYSSGSAAANILWAGGVKHTMSTANDAIDLVQFVMVHGANGVKVIYASVIGQAYA